MVREKTKTEVATIKLTPECRRAWEAAATSERRSLARQGGQEGGASMNCVFLQGWSQMPLHGGNTQ